MAQARALVLFDISRYLTDKYFDIVWGCHIPPRGPPQMDPPKIIFRMAKAGKLIVFNDIKY